MVPSRLKRGPTFTSRLKALASTKISGALMLSNLSTLYSLNSRVTADLSSRPERWKDVQEWGPSKPGINNLMTFGYGPQSCLGHRWATAEMKIFLVVLLSTFEFLPVEGVQIIKHNSILTRPYVKGEKGTHLPLIVRELK